MNDTNSTTSCFQYRRRSKSPSPETRNKIASALRGRVVSDKTREKLSASLRDYWSNPENFPDDQ